MKHGFMLIELIIATLIASMVGGILLTALAQGTRFQTAIDNIVDTSLRIGIVSNQLEKDLMGAFVPAQAESSEKEETEDQDEEAEIAEEKKPAIKKPDETQGKAKEKQKPLEKIFYATNKEGNMDQLTFITNNPLVVFVGKDVGVIKPKIVRVQYMLKPEVDKPNSYTLYRQESIELDLDKTKNIRSYEVIGGIKSLSAIYTARIEKKQEAAKASEGQQKEQQKISYEYKTSKDWVSERKKEGDKEQEFPRIPHSVEIKVVLWDKQDKQEKEFTVACEIPVDSTPIKKPELPKKVEQPIKKDEAQAGPQGQRTAHNNRGDTSGLPGLDGLESLLKKLTKMLG
jgi:hypothetical protein